MFLKSSRKGLKPREEESTTSSTKLFNERRSPVEDSLCECYIIQSRTAVENLYAANVLSCQKHEKVMQEISRQKMEKLSTLTREQNKLMKRMDDLKKRQKKLFII